ncbi:MAG: adenylosuccinate synthase [Deltaproteobacteria bacterium]|nr:MAG: adenylosuccinate synthase [Deltaproteobacteria bacterium]
MSTLVVTGAQWGDEGKGKVVDVLAAEADMVVRFAGGNNAGHTLVLDDTKLVTHLVPSGCRYPGTGCLLAAGMVIDPFVLREEVETLRSHGLLQGDELKVAYDAHVVMPYHRELDGLREEARARGRFPVGTTRRGIGPAYESKVGRRGVRIRDLFDRDALLARMEADLAVVEPERRALGASAAVDAAALADEVARASAWLEPYACDVGELVDDAVKAGRNVLFEGAQGALLDVDFGTYPFVTSSNTTAGGVCTGVGIGPGAIGEVWGITKAYTTRVGRGPFPTRAEPDAEARIREAGGEYGATTGRPRDCGWLDLPALRYAARINGYTGLCVTKIDVLARIPAPKVCVAYEDGARPGTVPFSQVRPVLADLEGWDAPDLADRVAAARSIESLPAPVRAYLDRIEEAVAVPVVLVSTGADRAQTFRLRDPFVEGR